MQLSRPESKSSPSSQSWPDFYVPLTQASRGMEMKWSHGEGHCCKFSVVNQLGQHILSLNTAKREREISISEKMTPLTEMLLTTTAY